MFIHNAKHHGVTLSDARGFAGRRKIHFVRSAPMGEERAVVERLFARLGKPYNLLFHNCEHTSSLARTGRAKSPTVRKWVAGLGSLAATALIALLARPKPRSGRSRSRRRR